MSNQTFNLDNQASNLDKQATNLDYQTSRFDRPTIEQLLSIYRLISAYYLQGIHHISVEQVSEIQNGIDGGIPLVEEACQIVTDSLLADQDTLMFATFDYNRLFIGPDKVLVPLYESAYRSSRRLLMQEQTLQVRKFYQQMGIENKQEGSLPDDHLGLELEFICYLLHQMLQSQEQSAMFYDRYCEFMTEHVLQWAITHTEQVMMHSRTPLCKEMAMMLKGILEHEQLIVREELQS